MPYLQIHRELTQANGYSLELDGINFLSPGNRYIGVTYPDQVKQFLSSQVVGKAGWETVLNASEKLEPIAVFQLLPASLDACFFMTFRTASGIYGIRQVLGVGDLKEGMKVWRRNQDLGWVFQDALVYSKRSNQVFSSNPLVDILLPLYSGGWGSTIRQRPNFSNDEYRLTKTWSEYIADRQEGCIEPAIEPMRVDTKFDWDGSRYPTYATQINQQIAMAQVMAEQRQALLDQQRYAMRPVYVTQAASWEPVSWIDSRKEEAAKTAPKAPAPEPVVKAKYGRLIKLVTEEDD